MNTNTTDPITTLIQERQQDYDIPARDFKKSGLMLSGFGFRCIDSKTGETRMIEAKDIPVMMILIKLSRESYKHKRDNTDDIQGYARTLQMIHDD